MSEMKRKKSDLVALWNTLNALGHITSTKLSYFIGKNKVKIKDEIDLLNAAQSAHGDGYKEFLQERDRIVGECAVRNRHGDVDMSEGRAIIDQAKVEDFNAKLKGLSIQFEDAIKEEIQRQEEVRKTIFEEPCDVFPEYKIKLDNIPDGSINADQMSVLLSFGLIITDEE